MTNKLYIQNFISIRNAELYIEAFTILIGPQAAGKSIVAKSAYLFRSFPRLLRQILMKDQGKREFDREYRSLFSTIFPEYAWAGKSFRVCYHTRYGEICFEGQPKSRTAPVRLSYSDHYANLIRRGKQLSKRVHDRVEKELESKSKRRRFMDSEHQYEYKLTKELRTFDFGFSQSLESPVFIPSGRSFFSSLETNVFAFLANNISIDHFLKEFGNTYGSAKSFLEFMRRDRNSEQRMKFDLLPKVIGGEYQRERRLGKEWILSPDGRRTEVAHASSGQQESLPMLIVLTVLPFLYDYVGNLYIVEEPEAHLFPASQKQILKMIVETYHQTEKQNSYLITTHSPYVLAVANVLAKAGIVRKELLETKPPKKELLGTLYDVVSKSQQIPQGCLSAYLVDEGTLKPIIDHATGLIDDAVIDAVSEDTSAEFESLLDVEAGNV